VIGGPCRLQCVCYAPTEIRPDETGMFERRKRGNQNRQQQSAVD
jgi:hypothetical protein